MWAAGVRAPDVLRDLDGLEINRVNQLVVEPTLQTTRDPDIFAIGDCAACPRPGKSDRAAARAGRASGGRHMLRQIERRLRGAAASLPIPGLRLAGLARPLDVPSGNLMGFLSGRGLFIEGSFAQLMYRSLRLMHERALNGTRQRHASRRLARALSRRTGPPVKLH